jgi:alpha-amylase
MKNIFLLAVALCCTPLLHAKKVKFSVDMSSWTKSPLGIHITGDFQDEAGFAADWDPGTTAMTQDAADTNIYHVVVDIPAFRAYEYKFVNGIYGYEQEFVPLQSRVNYNFIDSRWIYVDSLANDTLEIGAIRFSGNAPALKQLVRFYVDMQNETAVNTNGVHIAGWFQNWNPAATRMHTFDGNVYEYITYVDSNNTSAVYEYKYLNGNTTGDYENLLSWCANSSGNRSITVANDTMLNVVCYTSCSSCATVSIIEAETGNSISLYPNPTKGSTELMLPESSAGWSIQVLDASGRMLAQYHLLNTSRFTIPAEIFTGGLYLVRVSNTVSGDVFMQRLLVQ